MATIGVYRFDHASYIAALRGTGVDLVVDVRQRRGVRGREYAWANSVRLQSSLARAAIAYRHVRELAPTTELRQLQYRVDIFGGLLRTLPALMCVERDPLACHRSLIAARLQQTLGWRVQHIVPGPVEHSLSRRPGAP